MTISNPSRSSAPAASIVIVSAIVVTLWLTGSPALMNACQTNYDEKLIPKYKLPDPLTFNDGTALTDAEAWPKRRAEILGLFKKHVYGTMPEAKFRANIRETIKPFNILDDRATVFQLEFDFFDDEFKMPARLLLVVPNDRGPVPIFLGYNFQGNHSVMPDTRVIIGSVLNRKTNKMEPPDEGTRGSSARRWPIEKIIESGYGLATIHYGDIDPDFDDGFKNGVHSLYPDLQNRGDNWTSIGAWAWGLSRLVDHLEQDSRIDPNRIIVIGHSRLGKTSLWAGATDERFAAVISNDSGCGGAALARREFGETVKRINTVFPHWFCRDHKKYNDAVGKLPVDQHMLITLAAPRPVYIASAVEDRWADPKGEFLSGFHAQPVYELLGEKGGLPQTMPELDQSVGNRIGYHIRTGKHDVTEFDWQQYLDFADRHLPAKNTLESGK